VNLAKVVLAVNAITFLGFGVAFLVAPVELAANAELGVATPTARAEVRTIFGGFEVGLAAFLFACLGRPDRVAAGLLCSAFAMAGFAVARGASALLDGPVAPVMYWLLAAEVGGVAVSVVGWRMATRTKSEASCPSPN
jgi:hypothetical protein